MSQTFFHRYIASEVSRLTKWYDQIIIWRPSSKVNTHVSEYIDNPCKQIATEYHEIANSTTASASNRRVILMEGHLNYDLDFEDQLSGIYERLTRRDRIVAICFNPYLRWVYFVVGFLQTKNQGQPKVFLTNASLRQIAKLHQFEVVRTRPIVAVPWSLLGLGNLLNALIAGLPFLRWFSIACVVVLRPLKKSPSMPSLSVIVPARNEEKNIRPQLERLPHIPGVNLEVVFVEGHSKDETWKEIQIAASEYKGLWKVQHWQQTGVGKADAVRLGVEKSTSEIIVISDADITVPPEDLKRFYEAYANGHADFINGSRLLYPMEDGAMRFLNWLGNIFFAKTLSLVLETELTDSLCGTKLFCKDDFERMQRWRSDFGEIDPFGDFDLLFFSAQLGLGVMNVHVHYKSRTYGTTNILRFRHGLVLFAMTMLGGLKLRFGPLKIINRLAN